MKRSLAFDTSALISLGHTDLIELIIKNYNIVISEGILEELKEIAQFDDGDGLSAQKWLQQSSHFELQESTKMKFGEDELFEVCKREDIPIVTDDIRAIKRFERDIFCLFSVHIVYLLFKKRFISKIRAILSIEKMRTKRDWKINLISITAKTLFK